MPSSKALGKTVQIIFFNVPADETICRGIEKCLDPQIKNNSICTWSIIDVKPGRIAEAEIMSHLEIAHLILILVSPDLVASKYVYGKEMDKCMQMCHEGTRVVPIVVKNANWETSAFGQLTALMRGKPIKPCRNPQDAIFSVAKEVQHIAEEIALELRSQVLFSRDLPPGFLSSDIRSIEIENWTTSQDFRPLIEDISQISRYMQFADSDEHLTNLFQWLKNFPDHMQRLQTDLEIIEEFLRLFKHKKGDDGHAGE